LPAAPGKPSTVAETSRVPNPCLRDILPLPKLGQG
jgi:hypothetical protein